ncbi:MAG: PQQ-dependent dehydrogenase, methanol/ethanol family [Pseudomonadota bacterium]
MVAANQNTAAWFTTGGQFGETHYSSLQQINRANVSNLGFAWDYPLYSRRGIESTPVIVDGVVFGTGNWGSVYAVNAKTGERVWEFRPQLDGQIAKDACCDIVNRGVAVWADLLYVAALDGALYALNKDTGEIVWRADTFAGEPGRKSSTGAPRVAGDVVVIGFGGADMNARGYFTAYDLDTGEQRWRFYTVPGSPELPYEHPELEWAAGTWDPNSLWEAGLGGTVWDNMVYDPELNILYVGTGNSAVYAQKYRSPAGGDNLFVASILAIDPDTGRLLWHYQTTPGDQWDYTATQNMILTDLDWNGETRQVLLQAPKNGFFYVLDRVSGELLSAEKYAPANWASHVDMATGKPVLTDAADYVTKPSIVWPSTRGAHNWRPMSLSPDTGLVYIPAYEAVDLKVNLFPDEFDYDPRHWSAGVLPLPLIEAAVDAVDGFYPADDSINKDLLKQVIRDNRDKVPPNRTVLRAWDPVAAKIVWDIDIPEFGNSGAVLSTAGGLLFHTKPDGHLNVYNDETGELLKSIDTGSGMMAAPATYEIDGEQYIVTMSGLGGGGFFSYPPYTAAYKYGNSGRMMAFKLGGEETPKPNEITWPSQPEPPARTGDKETVLAGKRLFSWNCSVCHVNTGVGAIPNLKNMQPGTHQIFSQIVLEGLLVPNGMPSFADALTVEEVDAIHAYLIDTAWASFTSNARNETDEQTGGMSQH